MFNNLIRKFHTLDVVTLNVGVGGKNIGVDKIVGVDYEVIKAAFGTENTLTLVDAANPLPTTDNAAEVSLASIDFKMSTIITLLAAMTFIEVAATFAAISASTTKRLVFVTADETNNGDKSLYIYNGTALFFLQTIA